MLAVALDASQSTILPQLSSKKSNDITAQYEY